LQDPPKFSQIWIFGLKTNHLATLEDFTKPANFFSDSETHFWGVCVDVDGQRKK
jgi:hypothetical protein